MSYVIGKCKHNVVMAGMPIPDAENMDWNERAIEAINFGNECIEWLDSGLTLTRVTCTNVQLRNCKECEAKK